MSDHLHDLLLLRCREAASGSATLLDIETLAEGFGCYPEDALPEDLLRLSILGAAASAGLDPIAADQAYREGLARGRANPQPVPKDARWEEEVREDLWRRSVRHEAALRHDAALAAENPAPPGEHGMADDLLLSLGPEDPARVEKLLPAEGRLLVVAMRKTGKTTFVLNLSKSLITGRPFLGDLGVRKIKGRVAILNYEVSGRTMLKWLEEAGVPLDRVYLENLRGKRNPLLTEEGRAGLIERLRAADVEVLIVDPFGRAYRGKTQNDAAEVGAWLNGLDDVATEAGCSELILTAHAGWNGEHSRGSSALEDWPDSIAWMTRNDKDERFLKAEGRMDEDLHEDMLMWDPSTRTLTLSGAGSRAKSSRNRRVSALVGPCVTTVKANPGSSVRGVERLLRDNGVTVKSGETAEALREAVALDLLHTVEGPNGWPVYHYGEAVPEDCSPATGEQSP